MPTAASKMYTMQEAAKHNTPQDCWVVIDGKVYDVTRYLDEHPGGDDVLLSATGRDSTEEFEDAGHSKTARELMESYCIGELDPSPVIPEMEIFRKDESSDFRSKLTSISLQHNWGISAAAVIGVSVIAGILYSRRK